MFVEARLDAPPVDTGGVDEGGVDPAGTATLRGLLGWAALDGTLQVQKFATGGRAVAETRQTLVKPTREF